MYINKEDRQKFYESRNAVPTSDLIELKEKVDLILERLNSSLSSSVITEAVENTEDTITVEVDGETVVDTNDNDIADTIETTSEQENPSDTSGPEKMISDMLIGAIKDEYEAIQFYNDIIAAANDEGGFEDVVRILKHINEEEQIHVGMLQQVLKKFDTSAEAVETGKQEATDIIEDEALTIEDTAIEA